MTVTTKDGYTIEKKDRYYALYYKGNRAIGNATYEEIFCMLKFLREVKQTELQSGNN